MREHFFGKLVERSAESYAKLHLYEILFSPKQKKKTGRKRKPVIHGLGGWLARPSRHFIILEHSENDKVQKVSPKAIDLQKNTAKWQILHLKKSSKITFITEKVHSGCEFDTQNSLFYC